MYAAIQLHNLAARGQENNINCWRMLVRANLSQVILLTHRPASATKKKHAHKRRMLLFQRQFTPNVEQTSNFAQILRILLCSHIRSKS